MHTYVIGIDGGGSHTEGVLATVGGDILARAKKGPCSTQGTPFDEAKQNLSDLIRALLEERPDDGPVVCLFAGISGCGVAQDRQLYTETIRRAFPDTHTLQRIVVDTDVLTPAYAIGKSTDVIVAICGTGCVAFAVSGGQRHRIDGYGYLIGDDAGGFAIGSQVLRAILRQEDGRGPQTLMTRLFREAEGKSAVASVAEINRGGKGKVASYAPLAFAAAEQGDTIALQILDKAVEDITAMLTAAARYIDVKPVPVVIAGGIFKANDSYILRRVQQQLGADYTWHDNVTDVVLGAVYKAAALATDNQEE